MAESAQPSRIRVGIRCRPPFREEMEEEEEGEEGFRPVVVLTPATEEGQMGLVQLRAGTTKTRDFRFDHAFGPESSQDEVYDTIARPVVSAVLTGYNGTVFAYGQTGTGKTYTMGILNRVEDKDAGIVPHALAHVFDFARSHTDVDITVKISFLQIYRETIQDLLKPSAGATQDENLPIRESPSAGFYVEGLHEYLARSYDEAEALVNFGIENRAIAATLMNNTSSRSHTVLSVIIEQRGTSEAPASDLERAAEMSMSRTRRGKLLLVDLAGSERARDSENNGEQAKIEGAEINKRVHSSSHPRHARLLTCCCAARAGHQTAGRRTCT